MEKYLIVYGKYEGMEASAVNLLTAEISRYTNSPPTVARANDTGADGLCGKDVVILGTLSDNRLLADKYGSVADGDSEGYAVEVGERDGRNVIFIAANEMQGVYYGVVDFISSYLPTVAPTLFPNPNVKGAFDAPFNRLMPPFAIEKRPCVRNRAIWTWGHCILGYRKFFENMSLVRLNEVVIWNDCLPINAKEIVRFAHSYNIRVIWGFAWGWDTHCAEFDIKKCFDPSEVSAFADKTLEYYEKELLPSGADGIYFQSFTELPNDCINGINIADAVTAWVNGIAGRLFDKYPDLEILFGLHATSVARHLDCIAGVDKRIRIIWEDCGAFPYNYNPSKTDNYAATEAFTDRSATLRGSGEKFGCVYKGMTTLCWAAAVEGGRDNSVVEIFEHIDRRYVLGENSAAEIDALCAERLPSWKYYTAKWIKNADFAARLTRRISEKTDTDADIQLLVEYGAFEKAIMPPVALAAEMLWQPCGETADIVERVMQSPFVKFPQTCL